MRTLMTVAAMLLCSAHWAWGQAGQSCGFARDSDLSGGNTSSTSSDTCSGGGGGIAPDQGRNFVPAGFEPLMNQSAVLAGDYLNGARLLFSGEEPSVLAVNSIQSEQLERAANPFRQTSRELSKTLPAASRASVAACPDLKKVSFLVLASRTPGPTALRISHFLPAYSLISKHNGEISCVADDAQKWKRA